MWSRLSQSFLRRQGSQLAAVTSSRWAAAPTTSTFRRPFTSIEQAATADDAWKKSGYVEIDYTIHEDAFVYDAVQKLAAYNIGCLVTVDNDGKMTGIISERDYVSKIALLGRTSKETQIKEISTKAANMITAKLSDSVEDCMTKMLTKDIRHLPLQDGDGEVVGMISIKDLVKTVVQEKEMKIQVLSNFALGKGGSFGSE
mmetsp:Transcript_6518/g.14822  ORF Transcript_6518/g.14822 Transcript_6518/m.14822 type:complete len:200 (+) Transcript_6518:93-692(+)|eukprot:CAMPEP_0116841460 /NCGR_PEP_ID=MMETSP0418-20121206/10935_1 /TAXON_ID=1158023 /ORGANISM="Astrosyne radiata, Strain 13vi08-1A" /LENGTH=199 /DNA_ID=CAMNT_0004471885 /DNA_START=83 /DNA_END=682 /DNA_ORIENTATION=-